MDAPSQVRGTAVPGLRDGRLYPVDPQTRRTTWGIAAPILGLAMVVVTQLAGAWILEHFVRLDSRGSPLDVPGLIGFTVVPFGLLGVLLLGWVRLFEGRAIASIAGRPRSAVATFLAGYASGLGTLLLVVLAAWLMGGFRGWSPAPVPLPVLLQVAILAPCIALQSSVEELLFRGWLLSVLAEKFGVLAGVIVSSALFCLLHFDRGQTGVGTTSNFLFGVFACCCVMRFRSVFGAMGWHSGWNWLLAVGFGLPLSGLDVGIPALIVRLQPAGATWLHGGAQGPEASAACAFFFLVASALLLLVKNPFPRRRIDA